MIYTTRFLAQFFPPGRTAKLRKDILMFQQRQDESLYDVWTRFKDLLQKVPHHGFDLWLQVQQFFLRSSVDYTTQMAIDYVAGGRHRKLRPEEAWETIKDLAQHKEEEWNDLIFSEKESLDYIDAILKQELESMECRVESLMRDKLMGILIVLEQVFWLKHLNYNPDTSVKSHTPVRIESPSELPKVMAVLIIKSFIENELRKLKGKNVVDTAVSKPIATIALGMFKLDIEPISYRLKNNKDAHETRNFSTLKCVHNNDASRRVRNHHGGNGSISDLVDFECYHLIFPGGNVVVDLIFFVLVCEVFSIREKNCFAIFIACSPDFIKRVILFTKTAIDKKQWAMGCGFEFYYVFAFVARHCQVEDWFERNDLGMLGRLWVKDTEESMLEYMFQDIGEPQRHLSALEELYLYKRICVFYTYQWRSRHDRKRFELEAINQDHDEGLFGISFRSLAVLSGGKTTRGNECTINVNGIYNYEKVLKMLDRVFGHKSVECSSVLHQPDGIGSVSFDQLCSDVIARVLTTSLASPDGVVRNPDAVSTLCEQFFKPSLCQLAILSGFFQN
ncbi:zinc finger, CCHC-type containing protein [Tanacetum coccineum]